MEKIIIWETSIELIQACEKAVIQALKILGIRGSVLINSEPPLISRNQLWDRLPVIEIRGQYWSLIPGQAFTKEQLVSLFRKILFSEKTVVTSNSLKKE